MPSFQSYSNLGMVSHKGLIGALSPNQQHQSANASKCNPLDLTFYPPADFCHSSSNMPHAIQNMSCAVYIAHLLRCIISDAHMRCSLLLFTGLELYNCYNTVTGLCLPFQHLFSVSRLLVMQVWKCKCKLMEENRVFSSAFVSRKSMMLTIVMRLWSW